MTFIAEIHRVMSPIEEAGILPLWRQGFDTYDISFKLGIHECEIANRLMRLRQQEKQGAANDAIRN